MSFVYFVFSQRRNILLLFAYVSYSIYFNHIFKRKSNYQKRNRFSCIRNINKTLDKINILTDKPKRVFKKIYLFIFMINTTFFFNFGCPIYSMIKLSKENI